MKKRHVLFAILTFTGSWMLQAQKYLDRSNQDVKTEFNGQVIQGSRTLAANLEGVAELTEYGAFMAAYQEQKMPSDFMGTFFVITNEGLQVDDDTRVIQLLSTDNGRNELVESLVVPGRLGANELRQAATKRGGTFELRNLNGGTIKVVADGASLSLVDAQGRKATVIATDLFHKHGIFHVVDSFVFPADQGQD